VRKHALNPAPDLGDVIFILILQFLLFTSPNYLFGDGSTGWHLLAGRYILHNHSIPRHDLFSYTFSGAPWVAYEWLSDTLMAAAEAAGGLNGVAVLCASLIALVFLLVYDQCRRRGMNSLLSLCLTVAGALASSVHWLARPHLWSFLGVYVFSTSLEAFRRGTMGGARLVVTLGLAMAFWVNLHPAFLMGFALIAIYLGCELVGRRAKLRAYAAALAAALAGSLANPYGFNLYRYILNYLRGGQVLAATDEYRSPVFHGALQPTCLEILFAAVMIGFLFCRSKPALPALVSFLAFGHLALSAVRNAPVFAVVAVPLAADLFAGSGAPATGAGTETPAGGWFSRVRSCLSERARSFEATESLCKMHLLPAACVVILFIVSANHGRFMGRQLLVSGFPSRSLPGRTLDSITEQKLVPERGFNYDNWGGYIAYRLGIPVFIDDRADFYGIKFYTDYATVNLVCPGWQQVLDRYRIQWLLIPRQSLLAARLEGEPGWRLAAQDEAADLFTRR